MDTTEANLNEENLPTKELLRRQRKRDYERAKEARRQERLAEKEEKARQRLDAQATKDQALWQLMKPADQLGKD